jgi:hypothetical protein
MLRLGKLNVSLTKHGAHKIAILLRRYDKEHVLDHLSEPEPRINIDVAQARKNLSVGPGDAVPELWNSVRKMGPSAIDALVLLAIIFSHHALISAMIAGRTGPFRGTIRRSTFRDEKEFTNFAHTLEQLGFSTKREFARVSYDLKPLFKINGLEIVAAQLLALKLKTAGWNGKGNITDELISNNFNQALAISETQLRSWISKGDLTSDRSVIEDPDFFSGADELTVEGEFKFRPGHKSRKLGSILVTGAEQDATIEFLHNKMQTALYRSLVTQFGKDYVGTEVYTGQGTSIDIVVETPRFRWFYEIKVADSVRACIRQAIPQLLEYAYWQCDHAVADRLIIVAPFEITAGAERYLAFLRKQFRLPISYQEYDMD